MCESLSRDDVTFEETVTDDGEVNNVSVFDDKGEMMGYSIIVIHEDIYSLDSEISETDSYETADMVIRKLDHNKPIVELADVDVKRKYRSRGVSKLLLEYVLEKYKGYQFYMRVCPTDGVDENTLVSSVLKYGFIEVENTENGTFLIKR